jgi:hypothetical protein
MGQPLFKLVKGCLISSSLPASPFAITKTVSFVLVSPSTVILLKESFTPEQVPFLKAVC